MEPIYGKNNKEELPLEFYLAKFREGDPREMAERCALPYDGKALTMNLLGRSYTVTHPDFAIAGEPAPTNPERILFLRYLLDGRYVEPSGQYLTYREFPWGEVYLQQFTGRCIKRFAFSYGSRPEVLRIWFSRYRWLEKWKSCASWQNTTKWGGFTPTWVI